MTPPVQPALKEWAVVVEALTQGQTILILRKGGIREAGGRFAVQHSRFWLFPTYEHQQIDWLKPAYHPLLVNPAAATTPGSTVPSFHTLSSWAEVTHQVQIATAAAAAALFPFHVWSPALVAKRLQWKPQQPFYALVLRVYRLGEGLQLADQPGFMGCKSWLTLPLPPMQPQGAIAVLDTPNYQHQVDQLTHLLPFEPLQLHESHS